MVSITNPPSELRIGYVGENNFRTIQFDVSEWLKAHPAGTISIVFSRPDGEIYPVAAGITVSPAEWKPTTADLTVPGSGFVEIRIIDGDVIGKSCKIATRTISSLGSTGDPPIPPTPDWVQEAIESAPRAETAEQGAQAAEASAQLSAASAASNAIAARQFSDDALTYADTANAKALQAVESAESALSSKEAAAQSETYAASSASLAAASAANAKSSETAAAASKAGADSSAEAAAQSAQAASDSAASLVVVNDLTSGGAEKALSAEQGKTLKGLVDENSTSISELQDESTLPHGVKDVTDNKTYKMGLQIKDGKTQIVYEEVV